jgi:hypothetical protein
MRGADLDAERDALLAEERALVESKARLTPDDVAGHHAHSERLQAHHARIQAFHTLLFPGSRRPPPPADRRQRRVEIERCTKCGDADPQVLLRTPYLLYVRCQQCAALWTVWKPG